MKTARMLLGSVLVLSLVYLFVQAAESNHETAVRSTDDTLMRNYLRRFYENQLYVPRLQTSEIMAKRAAIPFSGGIYGKRAALPFSGGIYGKRGDSAIGDLDQVIVEARAMPMNGGFFG